MSFHDAMMFWVARAIVGAGLTVVGVVIILAVAWTCVTIDDRREARRRRTRS